MPLLTALATATTDRTGPSAATVRSRLLHQERQRCQPPHSPAKAIYRRRKETVERSLADTKHLHGQRYARFRILTRIRVWCPLAAAAHNIKKMAFRLSPKRRTTFA